MAVLSVETKKISELEAATTLNANSLFVADMPTVGTQKLAYSDLVGNIKDSLQIPRAANAVATSAIATEYTNSQTQVAAASQGYALNKIATAISKDLAVMQGAAGFGSSYTISDLLAAIRSDDIYAYCLGDYVTINNIKWVVMAKNYYSSLYISPYKSHAVLMATANVGTTQKMNSTSTNAGGYPATALKTWLESTFYNSLPSAVRSATIAVSGKESDMSTMVSYSSRRIQLPSNVQLGCYEGAELFRAWNLKFPGSGSTRLLSGEDDESYWTSTPQGGTTNTFLVYTAAENRLSYGQAQVARAVRPFIVVG